MAAILTKQTIAKNVLRYLADSTLALDKWYNVYDLVGKDTDLFHDALEVFMEKQPLRYVGLEFEYSDSHEDFRVKYYDPEMLYKYSAESEIAEGLRVPQKYNVGDEILFCKKCYTIRIFGKLCLNCKEFITNKINTNEINLEDYGRQ